MDIGQSYRLPGRLHTLLKAPASTQLIIDDKETTSNPHLNHTKLQICSPNSSSLIWPEARDMVVTCLSSARQTLGRNRIVGDRHITWERLIQIVSDYRVAKCPAIYDFHVK